MPAIRGFLPRNPVEIEMASLAQDTRVFASVKHAGEVAGTTYSAARPYEAGP